MQLYLPFPNQILSSFRSSQQGECGDNYKAEIWKWAVLNPQTSSAMRKHHLILQHPQAKGHALLLIPAQAKYVHMALRRLL